MTAIPAAPDALETCERFHLPAGEVASLRHALVSGERASDLAETFKLLGDLTRVRLLDALSKTELCVCDLAALVGLSESAVSHQLRLLRTRRLVRARRDGRMVFYALDDPHIQSLLEQTLSHVDETPRSPAADRS
jgi:DNA-binding transcriptional ArsR family regulator